MQLVKLFLVFLFLGFVNLSCSENILSAFQKTDDASLYADALKFINSGDYDSAITNFQQMSNGFLFVKEVAYNYAGAHAARGGFDLLNVITDIGGIGVTPPLRYAMGLYTAATATTSTDLITASQIINTYLGAATDRRDADNLFQIVVSYLMIGHILSTYADTDDNGVADWVTFDSCNSGNLPDTEATAIATGIASIVESVNALGSAPTGLSTTDISNGCNELELVLPALNFCAETDPASVTADQLRGVRTIIQEGTLFGINVGACGNAANTAATCLCP